MPFEERAIARASDYQIAPATVIRMCSAEDLIVLKVFADRPQDWLDVAGIVGRQGERLETSVIWQELMPLLDLKDDPAAAPRLRQLLSEL